MNLSKHAKMYKYAHPKKLSPSDVLHPVTVYFSQTATINTDMTYSQE